MSSKIRKSIEIEGLYWLANYLSETEIAEMLCVSGATINRWMSGERQIRKRYAERISRLLNSVRKIHRQAGNEALKEALRQQEAEGKN